MLLPVFVAMPLSGLAAKVGRCLMTVIIEEDLVTFSTLAHWPSIIGLLILVSI